MNTFLIKIKEAGRSFVVLAHRPIATGLAEERALMTVGFKPDDEGEEGRERTLERVTAYAHGISDGMNLVRSFMPNATWSGKVEQV